MKKVLLAIVAVMLVAAPMFVWAADTQNQPATLQTLAGTTWVYQDENVSVKYIFTESTIREEITLLRKNFGYMMTKEGCHILKTVAYTPKKGEPGIFFVFERGKRSQPAPAVEAKIVRKGDNLEVTEIRHYSIFVKDSLGERKESVVIKDSPQVLSLFVKR